MLWMAGAKNKRMGNKKTIKGNISCRYGIFTDSGVSGRSLGGINQKE